MIISERQINQLIAIAHNYVKENKRYEAVGAITETGKHNMSSAEELLMRIWAQQSSELKTVE